MPRWFKTLVLLVALAAGWHYAEPWVRARLGGGGARAAGGAGGDRDSAGAACLRAARTAREAYSSGMSSLGPPSRPNLGFRADLEDRIAAARVACDCLGPGCEPAARAVEILGQASAELEDRERIAVAALESARRLIAVDNLLDDAELALR